jgi:hypothetical protein
MEGQFPWVSENRRTKTVIKPKLNKWHPKTKKTVHHIVVSFGGSYIEFDHHVRLKETKQVIRHHIFTLKLKVVGIWVI